MAKQEKKRKGLNIFQQVTEKNVWDNAFQAARLALSSTIPPRVPLANLNKEQHQQIEKARHTIQRAIEDALERKQDPGWPMLQQTVRLCLDNLLLSARRTRNASAPITALARLNQFSGLLAFFDAAEILSVEDFNEFLTKGDQLFETLRQDDGVISFSDLRVVLEQLGYDGVDRKRMLDAALFVVQNRMIKPK